MKSCSTNHTKPFTLALGIAFAILILSMLGHALINGGLDFRSRAGTITIYSCLNTPDLCAAASGTSVAKTFCGSTCQRTCCKISASVRNTPTPLRATPTPTPTRSQMKPTPTPTLRPPTQKPTSVPTVAVKMVLLDPTIKITKSNYCMVVDGYELQIALEKKKPRTLFSSQDEWSTENTYTIPLRQEYNTAQHVPSKIAIYLQPNKQYRVVYGIYYLRQGKRKLIKETYDQPTNANSQITVFCPQSP